MGPAASTDTRTALPGRDPGQSSARQDGYARAFAHVVAVMMRDAHFRTLPIASLETLVLPPILSGQWRMAWSGANASWDGAHAKRQASAIPIAVVLWASVSESLDAELRRDPDKPLQVAPSNWLSGDYGWIIASAGTPHAVRLILQNLADTEFKDRSASMRVQDGEGLPKFVTLNDWVSRQ